MSQIVTIPGIGEAAFPDDMSPDQIEAALNEQFGDKSQPETPAPIQKPPTDLTRTNRFGESLGQLRQEAERVRGEAMSGNLLESGIDLAQRVAGTVAEMPSAPLNLMRAALPTQPLVSPEQGESVARFLNPFPAPEGSLARGIEKGAGELISGGTDPLVLSQILLGKRWPTQVAKGFQAQMLLGAPEAAKQVSEAQTSEELGKGLVSYGSALGFPLLIEAQLRKPALPLSQKAVREIEQKGVSDASSIEEAAVSVSGGTSGRGGVDLHIASTASGISKALREGNAGDLQHLLASAAMGEADLGRLYSRLSQREQSALETIGQDSLRGRSLSEAAESAIAVFNREASASRTASAIPSDEIGAVSRQEKRSAEETAGTQEQPLEETATPEQERTIDYASRVTSPTTLYGSLRSFSRQSQGKMPLEEGGKGIQPQTARRVEKEAQVLLTPDEQAYLDAERQGMDVDVQVTPTLPGDQPFAGLYATVDRPNQRILVNPKDFSDWLHKLPKKDWPMAVRSLLSEERIHLAVEDEQALAYLNTLSAAEKLIQRRRYTGSWRGIDPRTEQPISDVLLGHEALRFRLQQLARITPREIAETNWLSREGFTVRSITALEGAVRAVRETLGTKASSEAIAILDRVQGNLDAAKAVLAGSQEPGALRKSPTNEFEREVRSETTEQLQERLVPSTTKDWHLLNRVLVKRIGEASDIQTFANKRIKDLHVVHSRTANGLILQCPIRLFLSQETFGNGIRQILWAIFERRLAVAP